ncbi:MAG: sensor histidine kinase [Sphingomonadales bacterium]
MGFLSDRYRLYWVLQLGGWGTFLAGTFFLANIFNLEYPEAIIINRTIAMTLTGLLVSHLLRETLKRAGLMQKKLEQSIPWLLLSLALSSFIHGFLVLACFEAFDLYLSQEAIEKLNMGQLLLAVSLEMSTIMLLWLTIYCVYHYYTDSRQRQLDQLKLEGAIKQMELKTLKAHLNPHFIFNSLNSIRALVDLDPARARRAITELSNLLRGSLYTEQAQLVPLQKEIDMIRDYLALESIRFEDRMQVDWQIAADTLSLSVPPMMLQTLVENAIKHGIGTRPQGGRITITSKKLTEKNLHVLEIVNPGALSGVILQTGFGVSSTRSRLQLLYGAAARFEIVSEPEQTVKVTVSIPL